ncbi:MAG: hypothetical protein IKU79_02560 [Bacteroidaceae bacterium]|nr:hypothetical protein [Bacteroidaceae bacterium]
MKKITLHENMTLKEFITFAKAQPLGLFTEEVRDMLDVVRSGGSESQATYRKLVDAYLHVVLIIVKHHRGHGLDIVDLINAGIQGLHRALELYDRSNKILFFPYSVYWIRKYIMVAIAENNGIAAAVRSGQTDTEEFKALIGSFNENNQRILHRIYDLQ